MARDKLTEYSATASSNTVCGDVNIAENSALPSDMNNFAREIMSHLKNFSDGTDAIDALNVDNIKIDGNTISSTNTNGDITLDPNGTGDVVVASGKLGVGTASPDTPIEVKHSSTADALKISGNANGIAPYLSFENQESGTAYVRGRIRGASNGVNGGLIFETGNSGSMTERMRINGDGTWGKAPAGTVLQVVSASTTSNTSTSSTSFQSTNITASITPTSTSSKVLVIVSTATESVTASNVGADNQQLAIFRGSTDIASTNVGTREASGFHDYVQTGASLTKLDAPYSDTSTTYTVKIKSNHSSTTIKAPPNSHNGTITLLEIAG